MIGYINNQRYLLCGSSFHCVKILTPILGMGTLLIVLKAGYAITSGLTLKCDFLDQDIYKWYLRKYHQRIYYFRKIQFIPEECMVMT